jgi:hypothetical protein
MILLLLRTSCERDVALQVKRILLLDDTKWMDVNHFSLLAMLGNWRRLPGLL